MAKRFTDTNKYKKPFIRGLQGAYKLLWDYLYHDCDHAGVWIVDFEIAQLYIGQDMRINQATAIVVFNTDEERIVVFDDGKKWFIPSFIEFQYGQLNPKNRLHESVLNILNKYGLQNSIKPLTSPLQGAKDKDTVFISKDNPKDVSLEQPDTSLIFSLSKVQELFDNDFALDADVVRECGFSADQLQTAKNEFWTIKKRDTATTCESYQRFQFHFINWARLAKDRIKKPVEQKEAFAFKRIIRQEA